MNRTTSSIRTLQATVVIAALVTLGGCANMSAQDRSTVGGAGIGAVAGAVLTGGSPIGTVGGAAVGGVIGNAVSNPRR
jgi:osmotically inducible lipoprotein OsmB